MLNHRIPEQIKEDIIEVMAFVETTLPTCPIDEQNYLFEVYNKYIKPTYQDDLEDTCPRCRSEVISKIRMIVNGWKQQKQTS
jgi:pyruvate-formate lyase-activating enzyme